MTSDSAAPRRPAGPGRAVPAVLVGTIALLTAVPPFATDMYTPAIPHVTVALRTTAAMVGLTLTVFFLGFALGQLAGGPWSDQRGRRLPLLVGACVCALGAAVCAVAPTIWVMLAARAIQGIGGGIAASVARAVAVDVAHGDQLARLMSVLQALGGLAPMVAPVAGAVVLTATNWRGVFWALTVLGVLMVITGALFVPESLPPQRRHRGGLSHTLDSFATLLRQRSFVGYLLTSGFSGLCVMAYISDSSYVLQSIKGMRPLPFSLFFASAALSQVLLSILNARLIGRYRPTVLIRVGLTLSFLAVAGLTVSVLLFGIPLIPTCIGFLVLTAVQAFVFGNAGALAAMQARHAAGAATALQGVVTSTMMAISAPLASSGGGHSAVPMIIVMIVGVAAAIGCYVTLARHREVAEA